MAEIRNVNIDKEFIVKFGVCRTNISDDMLSIALEVLPKAIKEVLQETMAEDGEITVTPVKHGHWNVGYFHDRVCSCCTHPSNNLDDYPYKFCPHCGARMDGGRYGRSDNDT